MSEDPELLKTIIDHFQEHPEELAELLEQAKKVDGMQEKLNDLDEQLSISSTIAQIGLVASGGLAGFMIAGPVGALIGLAAVATILMFVSLFSNRGEIKEGAKNVLKDVRDTGKDVMHSLKNFIDKVPLRRSNAENFLKKFESKEFQEEYSKATGKSLPDDAAFVQQYLSNEDGFKALENLIAEKNASDKKFTLKDEKGKEVELTLDNLKVLKEKGDSTLTKADNGKFIAQLDKFKLLMSKTNKDIRKQVDEEQDKIHGTKKLQTPAPSSAGYYGSIKNTELVSKIDPGKQRTSVEGFLKNASELKKPFRQQNGGLYEILGKDPYNLDRDTLNNLEKKGNELADNTLNELASSLNNLTPDQIKDLNVKVNDLKKEQSKPPKTQKDEVKTPEPHAPERTASIPDR